MSIFLLSQFINFLDGVLTILNYVVQYQRVKKSFSFRHINIFFSGLIEKFNMALQGVETAKKIRR
jgi:hypothetical protein